jgi:hypothetical protein
MDESNQTIYFPDSSVVGGVGVVPPHVENFYLYPFFFILLMLGFLLGKGIVKPKWSLFLIMGVAIAAGCFRAVEGNPEGIAMLLFPIAGFIGGKISTKRSQ